MRIGTAEDRSLHDAIRMRPFRRRQKRSGADDFGRDHEPAVWANDQVEVT